MNSNKEAHTHEELRKLINTHVKQVNTSLAAFEQLKRHQIISAVWSVEGGEITPKLSLRRKVIFEKNKEVVAKIFGEGD